MANLKIRNLRKSYGDIDVMHGVDLDIEDGEFAVFVGPSGCGKSTLLRMIAGLEEITSGTVSIDGEEMNAVAPAKRGVAMVFQTYALYPHMTVYKNMSFGLKQIKTPQDEIDRRVRAAAEILQLTDYLDRSPRNLSGGQRQRVAIGRAIVRDPKVFLFDEPLSNLDAALRVQTRIEISKLHERLGSTMIYVTHDQVEAMTLADKIVVLRAGRIEQVGSPTDLYDTPNNMFVASFIGSPKMNFFGAKDLNSDTHVPETEVLGLRPEHLVPCDQSQSMVTGKIELLENLGEYVLAHLITASGVTFVAKIEREDSLKHGQDLHFHTLDKNIHRFDLKTEQRL
jgi:multiple sugar transport system ATP-binding protein/alpha-glucoside transport system ATP-binding protein